MTEDKCGTIFIVDDDDAVRKSLSVLVETVGLNAKTFSNAQDFLNSYDPNVHGCLILDVRMPGMSGLELHSKMISMKCDIPTIIMTGYGDIPMAVRAVKNGVIDFIEKPFRDQTLLDSIYAALEADLKIKAKRSEKGAVDAKITNLSTREKEVINLLINGKSNKEIASELNISQKTVDFHRHNILQKMGVDSLVELVHMIHKASLGSE